MHSSTFSEFNPKSHAIFTKSLEFPDPVESVGVSLVTEFSSENFHAPISLGIGHFTTVFASHPAGVN